MTRRSMRPHRPVLDRQPNLVTALAAGLDVLACFKTQPTLHFEDLRARTGFGQAELDGVMHTLVELGYLIRLHETDEYCLGPCALMLGSGPLESHQVRDLAAPLMQELAEATGTSVALGTRDGLNMVYIEVKKSSEAVLILNTGVGTRLPLATSAIGRAYLAICNEREHAELVEQIDRSEPAMAHDLRRQIDLSMATYEILGACGSFGDWQPDVNGIAVGLHAGHGLPPMSINCGAPAINAPPEFFLHQVRPQLVDLVRQIEEGLGQGRFRDA